MCAPDICRRNREGLGQKNMTFNQAVFMERLNLSVMPDRMFT